MPTFLPMQAFICAYFKPTCCFSFLPEAESGAFRFQIVPFCVACVLQMFNRSFAPVYVVRKAELRHSYSHAGLYRSFYAQLLFQCALV